MSHSENFIIEEYEYLLGALGAFCRGDKESYDSFIDDIRQDMSKEYNQNIDEKILRWIEVTRIKSFHRAQPVYSYIQAKMLYRDGFFEAAIMMSRSTAEMVCYDLLRTVNHPFGSFDEIEHTNFRRLLKFLFENTTLIEKRTYELLNQVYDIGNNYVHPKSRQEPKDDSRSCLMALGEAVFEIYGIKSDEEVYKTGTIIESAYTAFPAIGRGIYLGIVGYTTPEAAKNDAKRWGYIIE